MSHIRSKKSIPSWLKFNMWKCYEKGFESTKEDLGTSDPAALTWSWFLLSWLCKGGNYGELCLRVMACWPWPLTCKMKSLYPDDHVKFNDPLFFCGKLCRYQHPDVADMLAPKGWFPCTAQTDTNNDIEHPFWLKVCLFKVFTNIFMMGWMWVWGCLCLDVSSRTTALQAALHRQLVGNGFCTFVISGAAGIFYWRSEKYINFNWNFMEVKKGWNKNLFFGFVCCGMREVREEKTEATLSFYDITEVSVCYLQLW